MNRQHSLEERADVLRGKPVFKGTRITVEHVLRELGDGMTEEELLRGHPRLTRDHVRAAWAYAAAVIALEHTILGWRVPLRFLAAEDAPNHRPPSPRVPWRSVTPPGR